MEGSVREGVCTYMLKSPASVFLSKDVAHETPVSGPHDDRVVGEPRIAPAHAQIEEEAAHRLMNARETLVGPAAAGHMAEQPPVGVSDIGVAHDDVGGKEGPGFRASAGPRDADARHLPPPHLHAHRRRLRVHDAADLAEDGLQGGDQAVHPPAGVPHAAFLLQVRDHEEDGGRAERVASEKQGMKRVQETVSPVVEVACHGAGDRPPGVQAGHPGREPDHGGERVEGASAQSLGDHGVMNGPEIGVEGLEACGIARVVQRHRRLHALDVRGVVEPGAVVKPDPVEGIERHQGDVVAQAPPGRREHVLENRRRRDQAGAGVEHVSVPAQLARPPSELRAPFDQGGGHAGGLEADGRGQTSEATSDYDGAERPVPAGVARRRMWRPAIGAPDGPGSHRVRDHGVAGRRSTRRRLRARSRP